MKRTEQINVKITPETKEALKKIAESKDWTIAHTANRILENALGTRNTKEENNNDTKHK